MNEQTPASPERRSGSLGQMGASLPFRRRTLGRPPRDRAIVALLCLVTLTLLGRAVHGNNMLERVAAQPPPPTPVATAGATIAPPPDISGAWSVTRSWFRSCPRCGGAIIRTTTWTIRMEPGGGVRVDRGPVGGVVGDGVGGGWLTLEGLESQADSVYRFLYGSLRVHPGGDAFEGGFGGSERVTNPCGSSPPIVTCFASAGYLTAVRVATLTPIPGSGPTPGPISGSITPGPSPTPGTPVLPPPPGSTTTATSAATPAASASATSALPSASPSPTHTPTALPSAGAPPTDPPPTDTSAAPMVGTLYLPAVRLDDSPDGP